MVGVRTRFTQITFCVQLMDTSCFEVLYCRLAPLFCHSLVSVPSRMCDATLVRTDSPCVVYVAHHDAGSHGEVVCYSAYRNARVIHRNKYTHTVGVVHSAEMPLYCLFHWYCRFCVYSAWCLIHVLATWCAQFLPRCIYAGWSLLRKRSVRLSVRLSVTRENCDKTNESSAEILIPYER